jgi:hypothetical protein
VGGPRQVALSESGHSFGEHGHVAPGELGQVAEDGPRQVALSECSHSLGEPGHVPPGEPGQEALDSPGRIDVSQCRAGQSSSGGAWPVTLGSSWPWQRWLILQYIFNW